jgi:hypothetical protein
VALTECLRYEVEITRERLEDVTGQLERTVWMLNDRRRHYYESRMPYMHWVRKAGIGLGVVGFALAMFGQPSPGSRRALRTWCAMSFGPAR